MRDAGFTRAARFELGDVRLQSGNILARAFLSYESYGELNAAGDNCVLLPTYYTGTSSSYRSIIGPGRALDPERWFIVIPDMFGNGLSSSPSQLPTGEARAGFPAVSVVDNILCQHRLLVDALGVRSIALAAGWSLGAIQAYHWAAIYPEMVRNLLPICGAASCWPLNRVFLEGVSAALKADRDFAGGRYLKPPERGLRAFGRAYAGWAYSAAFFRDELYRSLGYKDLGAFLTAWEDEHLAWDANDLLAMLWTWSHADIGTLPGCGRDYRAGLARIRARTIVMPCAQDQYFTLEENRVEVAVLKQAELRPIISPYGHCAGAPGRFANETAQFETAMRELLCT